jgi:hypothetical protein
LGPGPPGCRRWRRLGRSWRWKCMSARRSRRSSSDSGELRRRRLSGRPSEVTQFVAGLQGPVRANAALVPGPTGPQLLVASASGASVARLRGRDQPDAESGNLPHLGIRARGEQLPQSSNRGGCVRRSPGATRRPGPRPSPAPHRGAARDRAPSARRGRAVTAWRSRVHVDPVRAAGRGRRAASHAGESRSAPISYLLEQSIERWQCLG